LSPPKLRHSPTGVPWQIRQDFHGELFFRDGLATKQKAQLTVQNRQIDRRLIRDAATEVHASCGHRDGHVPPGSVKLKNASAPSVVNLTITPASMLSTKSW
jgi:hypothetical protein